MTPKHHHIELPGDFYAMLCHDTGADTESWDRTARLVGRASELRAALSEFVSFVNYVINKRGSCVTSQHLTLDDDIVDAKEMLRIARDLLTATGED